MRYEIVDIGKIRPYENNPRVNDQAVDAIAESIRQYGFRKRIAVDGDYVVICGHTRLKAAKLLGMEKVPVIVHDDLTPEQVKAHRIADNKIGELATWNYELLICEMDELRDSGLDLSLLDFEIVDLAAPADDSVKKGETDPDAAPDVPDAPKSRRGSVYCLGDHRLMCGDSTRRDDMDKLMRGDLARLYLVDPPYNVTYVGKTKDALTIKNDSMSDEQFFAFLKSALGGAASCLEPGASFYIFHAESESVNFQLACRDTGLDVQDVLYWVKNTFVLGRNDYHYQTEPCLFGWTGGGQYQWHGDRLSGNLLRYKKPARNPDHPTPKPVDMLVQLIRNSSTRGDIVIDNFGGSGSTLIACEQTGRRCRMMEMDEKYCDVIRRRYAEFVGGEGCDWESVTPELAKEGDDAQ